MTDTIKGLGPDPVRLQFVRDATIDYRNFIAGERPLLWFPPDKAQRIIDGGDAVIDTAAPVWAEAVKNTTAVPPPQAAGNPHGSEFAAASAASAPQTAPADASRVGQASERRRGDLTPV